ncbi:MAG: DsrE family protein [Planctomycetota bacterium]
MSTTSQRRVQVVLTTGTKDPARARLGLDAALAAAVSGLEVTVFLGLDATVWACEPRKHPCGAPVWEVLDRLQQLGARVVCCSACALDKCGAGAPRADAAATAVDGVATAPGIELVGLTTLMEGVANGVATVTF